MLKKILILALAIMVNNIHASEKYPEPSAEYTLDIDGKPVPLVIGRRLQVKGTLTNPTLKLTVSPNKKFRYGNFNFEYPNYFSYEFENIDSEILFWSLEGKSVTLMIQSYKEDIGLKELATETFQEFSEKTSKLKYGKYPLANKLYHSATISTEIESVKIDTIIIQIGNSSPSAFILLQVTYDDNDKYPQEYASFKYILDRSFSYKSK